MPRFKCNDPDCEYYNIEELIPCVKFIWNDSTAKLEAKEAACPKCGNQRPTVKEPGDIVIPWFKAENSRNYQNRTTTTSKKYNY